MTILSRLTDDGRGRRIGYAVVIEGVPFIFVQNHSGTFPTGIINTLTGWSGGTSSWTNATVMKGVFDLEVGTKSIDMFQRRMIGSSMTFKVFDDDAGSLNSLFAVRRRSTARNGHNLSRTLTGARTIYGGASLPAYTAPEDVYYVGGETIVVTAVAAGSWTISVRGAYGSRAQPHFGSADVGEQIHQQPPSWVGRRAKLIVFFLDENGSLDTADTGLLDTFRLEEAPKEIESGLWELNFSHIVDEVASRTFGYGLKTVGGHTDKAITSPAANQLRYKVERSNIFNTNSDGKIYIAAKKSDGRWLVCRHRTTTNASDYSELTVDLPNIVSYRGPMQAAAGTTIDEARRMLVMSQMTASYCLLALMESNLGFNENGSFDTWCGLESTDVVNGDSFRFGANIKEADIDLQSIIDVDDGSPNWGYVIHEEEPLSGVLRDYCLFSECFWYVSLSGQITMKKLFTSSGASKTLTDIIGEVEMRIDEDAIFPRLKVRLGYDPLEVEFTQEINLYDRSLIQKYPNKSDVVVIESKSLWHDGADFNGKIPRRVFPVAVLESVFRRFQAADGRGRLIAKVRTHLEAMTYELGELINIGFSGNDFEGGDISGKIGRVLSITPDLKNGFVDLELHVTDRSLVVAPAAIISVVDGTQTILTLSTGFPLDSAAPTRKFQANNGDIINVLVYDVSTSTWSELLTATVTNDTQLTLGTSPTLITMAAGDIVVPADMGDRDAAGVNANGYGINDWGYGVADDGVATIGASITRWR